MKFFTWSNEKNQRQKIERNISFEEVVYYIEKGQILDIVQNPNSAKYKDQKILIVDINDYAYLVPFLEKDEEVVLITIIPSRKATRKYLRGGDEYKRNQPRRS